MKNTTSLNINTKATHEIHHVNVFLPISTKFQIFHLAEYMTVCGQCFTLVLQEMEHFICPDPGPQDLNCDLIKWNWGKYLDEISRKM